MDASDLAILIVRLWLGVVMLAHGFNHGRNLARTATWFASKGFSQARHIARASAGAEVAIGLGLITGLLTSFAAAGLVATMVVAFGAIHRFAGFFVFARPDEGYEYVATLAAGATALAILGPGPVSIDSLLGIAEGLDSWAGLAIVAGGGLVGAVQLAAGWRRPTTEAVIRADIGETVS